MPNVPKIQIVYLISVVPTEFVKVAPKTLTALKLIRSVMKIFVSVPHKFAQKVSA
jgi:hypothetical protein